jgi:hypothetical protein
MSATMAKQEDSAQLEQSNMYLAWNIARMAKRGCLHTAMEETQYMTKYHLPQVREEQ